MPFILPPTLIMNWQQLVAPSLTTDDSGFSSLSRRLQFSSAVLVQQYGTRVRVTLKPNGVTSATVSAAYVGLKGASAPDFDGNQAQLKWGGSGSVTLTGGGADQVSDETVLKYLPGSDLIVSLEFSAVFACKDNAALGANYTDWSSATTGQAGSTTGTGYSSTSGRIMSVSKVEILV